MVRAVRLPQPTSTGTRSRNHSSIPTYGVHSVSVPGAIDAWCRLLADHGRKGIDAALAPAIHYAESGYVVHDRVAFDWANSEELLKSDETTRRIFLPGGKAPAPGTVHVQAELARTLRLIADKGRAGFYEGEVAEDIVSRLRALGGLHTLQDFAATEGNYTEPVSTEYRGYRVHQMPPNNQGLTALLMLNILSGFDLAGLDPVGAKRLHLEIEAGRLAYRERDSLIGDQDFAKVPVSQLLSVDYANRLRRDIDANKAMKDLPDVEMAMSDTVYISVVDKDRNAVSFINSTFHSFGSGITSPKNGCRPAEPGLKLQARSTSSQRPRTTQEAHAHHHAWHGDQGRTCGYAIRCHGRGLPTLRPRSFADQSS